MKKPLQVLVLKLIWLLQYKKPTSFEVGPSEPYPSLIKHMIKAIIEVTSSMSHRGKWFQSIYKQLVEVLSQLFGVPRDWEFFFCSSGTECMERLIQNLVIRKSAHVVYGAFSKRWYTTSKELKKDAQKYEVTFGEIPNLSKVHFDDDVEVICVTINETSTGAMLPMADLRILKELYPNALILLDIVSVAPMISVDFEVADAVFFSVQKAFGLMAGLGVMIVGPRALKKSAGIDAGIDMTDIEKQYVTTGTYHSFRELRKAGLNNETPDTPNVWGMVLLLGIATDYLKNIRKMRLKTHDSSHSLYLFFSHHESEKFSVFIVPDKYRSITTLVINVAGGSDWLIKGLLENGCKVSDGYGDKKGLQIRIGLFPATLSKVRKLKHAVDVVAISAK